MRRGEIIAVEGVCCAGKTTLVTGLSRKFKTTVMPELPAFGRNLFQPFESKDNILHNGYTSIGLEKVRMIGALGLSELSRHVILDRSIMSALAINYGAIDVLGAPAFRGLAGAILSELGTEKIATPNKMFYISVDGQVVEERNRNRVPQLEEYWTDSRRVDRQNEFYEHLRGLDGVVFIDGAQTHDEVLDDCSSHIVSDERICGDALTARIESFVRHI